MFDLADKALVWIPISWPGLKQADPDAVAEPTTFEIQVLAEILDKDEMRAVFGADEEEAPEDETMDQAYERQRSKELKAFMRVVSDWRGFKIAGQPAEFNEANARRLIALPNFGTGFNTSYLTAWAGRIELATKNSESSSDSGQPDAGGQKKPKTPRSQKKLNS
jgi:hypothetical protein